MTFEIKDDSIYFCRAGEIGRLSACGENSIRFQASASGKLVEQDWTLMPRKAVANAWIENKDSAKEAFIEVGNLKARLEECGRVTYFRNGEEILREQPELTFNMGYRHYKSKDSNLWNLRVTFEAREGEEF